MEQNDDAWPNLGQPSLVAPGTHHLVQPPFYISLTTKKWVVSGSPPPSILGQKG